MTASKDAQLPLSQEALRMRPNPIRALSKLLSRPDVISFAGGMPSPATFPREELAEIASQLIRERGETVLQYGTTRGVPTLLECVAERMRRRSVGWVGVDDVMLTSGSQQALDLVARVLVDPGDVVLVELPSYVGGLASLYAAGADLVGFKLTESGPDLDHLERQITALKSEGRRVRAIYTIPTFQNPSGITSNETSRNALLETATRHDVVVLEDDPYGEVYFSEAERPPLPIASREGSSSHVVYLGSFSKVLCPGLRTGWIAAKGELVRRFELAKEAADLCSSVLDHSIVAEAVTRGLVDERLPLIREFYAQRCSAMLDALEPLGEHDCRWTRPTGGLFVWVEVRDGIDTRSLLETAVSKGVAFVPGAPFFVDGSGANTLRLAFSKEDPARIREGIAILAGLLQNERGE